MSEPCLPYSTTEEVAHKVKKIAKKDDKEFTARPWNRYSKNELYWLVPSTDWPAYEYGKAFFRFTEGKQPFLNPQFFVGFHVERGLSRDFVKASGIKSSLIMNQQWIWYNFLSNLKGTAVKSKIQKIMEVSKLPIIINVDVAIPRGPQGWDTKREDWFEIQSNQNIIKLKHLGSPKLGANNPLAGLEESQNLVNLAIFLESEMPKSKYKGHWVDLYIGIAIPPCSSSNREPWGAADLWGKVLSPWKSWLRNESG